METAIRISEMREIQNFIIDYVDDDDHHEDDLDFLDQFEIKNDSQ